MLKLHAGVTFIAVCSTNNMTPAELHSANTWGAKKKEGLAAENAIETST